MNWTPVMKGLLTRVPGLMALRRGATRGSDSARYCYSVWLRHLVRAQRAGLDTRWERVAELGPGDSLGIGMCAVLSGAERYIGLDIVRYAPDERNAAVLEELIELFAQRAPIPDAAEFPGVYPTLPDYAFPPAILDDARMARCLAPARLRAIRSAVRGGQGDTVRFEYAVPWHEQVESESVDLVCSQACLEHVDDLELTYRAMRRWLRPGGVMSHVIDFRSHGITPEWDGVRQYGPLLWDLVRGRRPFLLNREPLSRHHGLCGANGFEIVACEVREAAPELASDALAPDFAAWDEADRRATMALLLARRAS